MWAVQWGSPQIGLYALPIVICAVLLIIKRFWAWRATVAQLGGETPHRLFEAYSVGRPIFRVILMMITFVALMLSIMRPQRMAEQEKIVQQGRDLLIALDVSRSMLAADVTPSRLAFAKYKIKKLLKLLGCERVGLVLFSKSAFVQCPLTIDYDAFELFLDAVDAEIVSSGSTAISQAISKAVSCYQESPDRKTKLLVIFTDGEDFSPQLADARKQAKETGLALFTYGIGTTEGAPIPVYDTEGNQTGHQLDERGNVVITRLNERLLQSLATEIGGSYIPLTDDERDMKLLADQVHCFEKEQFADSAIDTAVSLHHYALFIAFITCVLEWII